MNKKDLICTYICAFICIACCVTLHYPSPYHFPFMVFILLLGYPLSFKKYLKNPILHGKIWIKQELKIVSILNL